MTTARLPREAEPRLPWLWLSPANALWLVVGFSVLCATGAGTAIIFADATPVWVTGTGLGDIAGLGVTPQAETLQPGENTVDLRVAVWLADRRLDWLLALATFGAHVAKIWVVSPLVVVVGAVVWHRTGRANASGCRPWAWSAGWPVRRRQAHRVSTPPAHVGDCGGGVRGRRFPQGT